jgi:very-short-patch-repair endonuclease
MSGQLVHNIPALKQRRRDLRQNLTTAEAVLWKNLRRSRLDGKKFRRQHSVGKYVLDFYCPECRLAVELDGDAHFTSIRSEYDVEREEFIKSLKIRIVRFENRRVFEALENVLKTIKENLAASKLPS